MKDLNTHLGPGQASSTPEKEKPGEPSFKNENIEAQYTSLPRYKNAAQSLALLREQHTVFWDCLPLAIGIHRAIGAAYSKFGKTTIRLALQFHGHSLPYLKNLAAGIYRYDLKGKPGGLITLEHQQQAREKLTARRQAPKPTPRANPASNITPVDAAAPDATVQRLSKTRPRLTLKRKEGEKRTSTGVIRGVMQQASKLGEGEQ
jgi:ProP effector